jgi:hypothetical protein
MPSYLIGLLLSLVLALPASAAIYRYTDERGNQVFTNQPPADAGSEEVELRAPNLIPPPAGEVKPAAQEEPEDGYRRLEVLGTPADGVIRESSLQVEVAISPLLRRKHSLTLLLDGQEVEGSGRATTFSLDGIERGVHQLQAVVRGEDGFEQRSEVVEFTRLQINLNSPAWGGQKGGGQ